MRSKFIFVTGGVVSSLGKGLASASIGALMESRGLTVTFLKFDPYINVDPGTMNPFQHGEVYVTDDGAETDLDLGHYERYTHVTLSKDNNCTTGKIYNSVISKERRGDYLGGTVQVIPHITEEIMSNIRKLADGVDIVITEIGGTVGDIEGLPFLEAIRQFKLEVGKENALYIHLTFVPYLPKAGELKTKPTQHSVKELRGIGIQPDIILCRTDRFLPKEVKAKIALFCNLEEDAVITAKDVDTIYEVPIVFHKEGLDEKIVEKLNIWTKAPDLSDWEKIVEKIKSPGETINIAIVGKYVDLTESYKSLNEAITHGGMANSCRVDLIFVDSETIDSDDDAKKKLNKADGVIVPGGFGNRGIEGKIRAIHYARINNVPFLGICLGMQLSVVEFARNVAGLDDAHSEEFDPKTPYPVIYWMSYWRDQENEIQKREGDIPMGGTMRLGAYPCVLKKPSIAWDAYKTETILERHRHRYELNNKFLDVLTKNGMVVSGKSPDGELVEIIELKNHPWFLGCQFHPEFKSLPRSPHPLFTSFIQASLKNSRSDKTL